VTLIDRVVADRLADQVAGDGPAAEPVAGEQLPAALHVVRLGQGAVHLEVVSPAG
jgi:hypothetical protein